MTYSYAYSYARIERLHYHSYLTYYIFRRSKCFGDRFIGVLSDFLESKLNVSNIKNLMRDVIHSSLILHDIGKAYKGYQRVVHELYGEASFGYHEILSSIITYSYLRSYVTTRIRALNIDGDVKKRLRDYLTLPASIAVLMHHEALRNYVDILTKLRYEMSKFLRVVVKEGFIEGEVLLIDRILESLGIKDVKLSDVINQLISRGFQRRYDGIREYFMIYSRNPDVEYLATNITAAIQLCDRLAASITRGGLNRSLRRLEHEFINYCLSPGDASINEFLTRIGDEAARELRNIISK